MKDDLKDEILNNIREDRENIQDHINKLKMMIEESDGPMSALIEFLTGSYRIKADINDQLIKLYNIEKKAKNNNNNLLNDILLEDDNS